MNFKEWWQKPVTREDRVVAVVISAIGGAIIGFIARIYVGSVPTPLLDYVIWAALGFVFFAALSYFFPRPVSLICVPFVKLLEGI